MAKATKPTRGRSAVTRKAAAKKPKTGTRAAAPARGKAPQAIPKPDARRAVTPVKVAPKSSARGAAKPPMTKADLQAQVGRLERANAKLKAAAKERETVVAELERELAASKRELVKARREAAKAGSTADATAPEEAVAPGIRRLSEVAAEGTAEPTAEEGPVLPGMATGEDMAMSEGRQDTGTAQPKASAADGEGPGHGPTRSEAAVEWLPNEEGGHQAEADESAAPEVVRPIGEVGDSSSNIDPQREAEGDRGAERDSLSATQKERKPAPGTAPS